MIAAERTESEFIKAFFGVTAHLHALKAYRSNFAHSPKHPNPADQ
jgi:hypothetical protein